MCYSLLLRLLRSIDAEWDPIVVRGDLVGRSEMSRNSKKLRPLTSSSLTPIEVFGGAGNVSRRALTSRPCCVQERQLSDSFRLYTEHCLCLMKNMRQVFPCASAVAITRFELMLR